MHRFLVALVSAICAVAAWSCGGGDSDSTTETAPRPDSLERIVHVDTTVAPGEMFSSSDLRRLYEGRGVLRGEDGAQRDLTLRIRRIQYGRGTTVLFSYVLHDGTRRLEGAGSGDMYRGTISMRHLGSGSVVRALDGGLVLRAAGEPRRWEFAEAALE